MATPSVRSVLLVVVVVLAGCAGGPSTPAPADDPTTAPPATASVAAPNGTLEVHFINVGQSVSTLLVGPTGETMLIDSGDFTDDGEYVIQYLERRGIERIDYLVTSHADADHIGGHAAVIRHLETEGDGVGAIYDPGIAASTQTYEAYLDAVERYNVTLYRAQAGDTIPMAGITARVLGPPEEYLADRDRNENSLVLRVAFGNTSFLFTGDAESAGEGALVETYGERLDATVLKAGHHGSKSSTGSGLLDAVDPWVVVISSAYDSRYGHPHEEVLSRLGERSIRTYWTGVHGDVVLVSDGRSVEIRTQQAAPTAPAELRAAEPVAPGTTAPVVPRYRFTAAGDGTTITGAATAGSPVATDGGIPIELTTVHADADGRDGDNLNDEYIVLTNVGDAPIDLSGWTVTDAADHTYTVPSNVTLAAGASVTIHTGAGTDTATDLYWGADAPVWNNDGDTVTVRTANGTVVLETTYGGG